jgi:hypothetical protein
MQDLTRALLQRKFLDWPAEYASRKIATFPVSISAEGKKPLIRNYQHIGLPASAQIARRFADAQGIAFMAGVRNGITALDIDETGNKPLQRALERHGYSPVIVQTASGKHHVWYRCNGERRAVRPEPGNEIDILGGGMVTAPPSHGPQGDYQFISGGLDDLDRLPVMRNVPDRALPLIPKPKQIEQKATGRNDALFRFCMRTAKRCNSLDQLLNHARNHNGEYLSPLEESEVMTTAASAWRYETTGKNWFGHISVHFRDYEFDQFSCNQDQDRFWLISYLRRHNGKSSRFMIANGLADVFGWSVKRLAATRRRALEEGDIIQLRRGANRTPALFCWPLPR